MQGLKNTSQEVVVGNLSPFLDLGNIDLKEDAKLLSEVTVNSSRQRDGVSDKDG
jgi:hypothetical protein